jgi:hypothetical protein
VLGGSRPLVGNFEHRVSKSVPIRDASAPQSSRVLRGPHRLVFRPPPPYAPLVPIYIVRWANRSASIIRADDERHLRLLLDEVGNTDAALWEEYDGPLWIELEPRWRQTETTELELADDHSDAHTQPWDVLEPGPAGGDTSLATFWTILARLFPHLYLTLREVTDDEFLDDDQAKKLIVEALEREQWFADAYDKRPRHQSSPEEMALWASVLEGRLHVKRDLEAEREEIATLLREEAEWRAAHYMRLRAERQEALVDLEPFVRDDVDDDDLDDDQGDLN